jgi:hypothetical protein
MTVPERDLAPDAPTEQFRAVVERYEGAPNQCTIFPADASGGERRTAWVTAVEPGFVHLADCR